MAAPLLLVGCGKMGGALLEGWIKGGTSPGSVYVVEPNPETAAHLSSSRGVHTFGGPDDLPDGLAPALVMFAIKPQMMAGVVDKFAKYAGPDTVFLSIAAGTPMAFFEAELGDSAHIVRAMPNTPAAVGRGVSVCFANGLTTEDQRSLCTDLMSAVGHVHWIDDEGLMDAVTGVSGSGPAYVFHMVEALRDAGIAAGLPENLAADLARATVEGAGELLYQAADTSPDILRQNVTSPGGTTAAALAVLMADQGLSALMTRAVAAARDRGRELAG